MKEGQIVLTVTALVLFLLESAEAQMPPAAQVNALNDLTKHWPTLTLAADVCSTEWLSCDNGNVITLKLKGRGLNGSIPEYVGNLTGLTQLHLDNNTLGGSIPEFLGKLTSLDLLRLSTNQFTGTIPESLRNLKKLTYLYLDDNYLTGSIPESLGNLTNLLLLSLSNNGLEGSIPASLGNLQNLTDLYLNNNFLSGSIPESLGNPKKLDRLYLNDNYLVGSIPGSLLSRPQAEGFNTTNNCLLGDPIQRDGCPSGPSPVPPPPPSKVAPAPGPTKVDPLGPGPPSSATSRGNWSSVLTVAVPAAGVSIFAFLIAAFFCAKFWKKKKAARGRGAPPAPLMQNHTVVVINGQLTQELQQLPVRSVQNGEVPVQGPTRELQELPEPSVQNGELPVQGSTQEIQPQELQQLPESSIEYGEVLVEGVRCLFEPNPTLPEQFDIVLFPGPNTAWRTRDRSVTCWPMEWLPAEFPEARLLMVEFPKGLLLWQSAINHTQALTRDNVGLGNRPYFLVAHSVGGVLAKELLLRADFVKKEVVSMCKGIVFYGVPQLDEPPVKSALFGIPESEMGQFEGNESLKRYLDFQALQGKFPTYCFIERMETTIGGRKMMVSAESQVIKANARTVGFVPDADHFQVCMPKAKTDLIVCILVDFIKSFKDPQC